MNEYQRRCLACESEWVDFAALLPLVGCPFCGSNNTNIRSVSASISAANPAEKRGRSAQTLGPVAEEALTPMQREGTAAEGRT